MTDFKKKDNLSTLPSYLRPLSSFPEVKPNCLTYPSISIEKPWNTSNSPYYLKTFSPKTSYALSFGPNTSSSIHLKKAGKKIIGSQNDFYGPKPFKSYSNSKFLLKAAEVITNQTVHYGKKISPLKINEPVRVSPEHFEPSKPQMAHLRISPDNASWISNRTLVKNVESFNRGEYIPSMTQMQIYGRKNAKSKFEGNELWKKRNIFDY